MNELFSRIEVLFEDDDILVINKPSGLVVTPGSAYPPEKTLVGWLIKRFGESFHDVCIEGHRPGIVHRLDKDTSGVMIVAKSKPALLNLISQFKEKQVNKVYTAIVWGNIRYTMEKKYPNKKIDQLIINAPIGRNPRQPFKFALISSGKPAITEIEVQKITQLKGYQFSILVVKPKTGRTHQIRVHCKALGHSLIGDVLYQSKTEFKQFSAFRKTQSVVNRLYLHASKISLIHPKSGLEITFSTPLPPEFGIFLKSNL